jgi:uncharacterized protein YndB with AHSA1/START domain
MTGLTVTAPEGLPFVDIEREFDAPVSAVFRAYTDRELFSRWIGPRSHTTTIEEWQPADGGRWSYVSRDDRGEDYVFRGSFHTVRDDELIVQTFEYVGWPDVVSIESMRFEDLGGGRTRIAAHSVFPTVEARDAMVTSGMEYGIREGFEQLDELLAAAVTR